MKNIILALFFILISSCGDNPIDITGPEPPVVVEPDDPLNPPPDEPPIMINPGSQFSWDDTREVRAPDSAVYGILNDMEYSVNPDLISALQQYNIKTLLWSERDKYIDELAA